MNFVKRLLKKINNCVRNRKTNAQPLGESVNIEEHFRNITNNKIVTIKKVWSYVRPLLVNKDSLNICEIVTATKKIVQVLNDHYVNLVEISSGEKSTSIVKQSC